MVANDFWLLGCSDNLQISYNHETRKEKILLIFHKTFVRNKNFPKQLFGNSILKFARLRACKSLINLNLYKSKWCWLEDLYLCKFLLSKSFEFYGFEDFINLLLQSNFSRTEYFNGHLSGTYLELKGT